MMLRRFYQKNEIEAGCDEAGRGCLAGPVVAAAVILSRKFRHPLLNDSKLLNHKQRNKLRPIIERKAIAWSVQFVFPEEIDQINILQASVVAMKRSAEDLSTTPTLLLIDGKYFVPHPTFQHQCIIKGDSKYTSIAAASILAKTYRDEYMEKLHQDFPIYGWSENKGYPTKMHRQAIIDHGPCEHHRQSFKLYPSPEQLVLFD